MTDEQIFELVKEHFNATYDKLLKWHLTDTDPQIHLDVPITKEGYDD